MPLDRRFPAMGARARIWLDGSTDELADRLVARVDELEQRWSRFIADSDVCTMNAGAGEAVPVHAETIDLVRRALSASKKTGGLFDPTMGRTIADAGYHVPFDQLVQLGEGFIPSGDGTARTVTAVHAPAGTKTRIVVDREASTITVPVGIAFDPGGIGKGRAADLVAEEAIFCGASSAFVDIGGDVRLAGNPPPGGWPVQVDDPRGGDEPLTTLRLPSSAVSTSSVRKRRWRNALGPMHHVFDPTTKSPSDSDLMAITVLASESWWAEALATASIVGGRETALRLLEAGGATGLWVTTDGELEFGPGAERYVA